MPLECIAALSFVGRRLLKIWKLHLHFHWPHFFPTRRLSLWSIYPITLHAQTSFQSALNLANTGGVSLPGAKQVVHFPGWLQAGKQFFRHRGTQAPLTVAASAKRSWICLWRSSRDTVTSNKVTRAHAVWLGVWIIYIRFIYRLGLNKRASLTN